MPASRRDGVTVAGQSFVVKFYIVGPSEIPMEPPALSNEAKVLIRRTLDMRSLSIEKSFSMERLLRNAVFRLAWMKGDTLPEDRPDRKVLAIVDKRIAWTMVVEVRLKSYDTLAISRAPLVQPEHGLEQEELA